MSKKIAVATGSRADYGQLRPVLEKIKNDPELDLQLYVTGMHLEESFGRTVTEIQNDGYEIKKQIDIFLQDETPKGTARSSALALMGFADALDNDRPDMLLLLGDRFEIFGAAAAAVFLGIPIGHIHGGELTEGAMDEQFRHSITKMAQLHFAAAEVYRQRIIQMGEQPDRVFCTGAPSVDAAVSVELYSREELERKMGVKLKEKNLMVIFHPVMMDGMTAEEQFAEVLGALKKTDAYLLFVYSNADTGGSAVNRMIEKFVSENADRACVRKSFGYRGFFSVMNICDGMVGNSSAGIIEASVFGRGAVNVGTRQRGRARGANVIDCGNSESAISEALEFLLSENYRESLVGSVSPYGEPGAAERIVDIIKNTDLKGLGIQKFYDQRKR